MVFDKGCFLSWFYFMPINLPVQQLHFRPEIAFACCKFVF